VWRAGEHEAGKERSAAWQPYTPGSRLANLHLLDTK
jgi:hypothetical protein